MKRAIPLFALLLIAGLLRSAHAEPGTSQPRAVPAFHAIELAGTLEVSVNVGGPASVELVGDAELFDKVSTTVKNGVLVIDTRFPRDRGNHRMKAVVRAPDLTALAITGTGSMNVTGVANDHLAINVPGTGEVSVAGSTGALRVDIDGTGSVAAKHLTAKSAQVSVGGTGDASLNASESLDARVAGTGSISVHGSPTRVTKSVSGVGSIHVR